MSELVSEPVEPMAGTFDTTRMGRGEPGLPRVFRWRGTESTVVEELETWKESSREGGSGELYLRRHCFRLRMSDGSVWVVYFTRQTPESGNPRTRWFLYTVDDDDRRSTGREPGDRSAGSRPRL